MVEHLRGCGPLGAEVSPAGWAIRIAGNLDDPVALHVDQDLTYAVAATAGRSDDASIGSHVLIRLFGPCLVLTFW